MRQTALLTTVAVSVLDGGEVVLKSLADFLTRGHLCLTGHHGLRVVATVFLHLLVIVFLQGLDHMGDLSGVRRLFCKLLGDPLHVAFQRTKREGQRGGILYRLQELESCVRVRRSSDIVRDVRCVACDISPTLVEFALNENCGGARNAHHTVEGVHRADEVGVVAVC